MKKLLAIAMMLWAFGPKAQSLDDYLKIAAENNPGLKAKYAEFEATLQRIPQVRSLPDPTLSVSAFGQMMETRVGPQEAVFILNQMFPWFGTLKAREDAAALMAEARFQGWLDARNDLFFRVKAAYYPLYELEQVLRYQQENETILETYKALALTRFRNGEGSMTDVVRADIMIGDVATEISLLQARRKPLLARFNQLLNRDPGHRVSLPDTLTLQDAPIDLPKDSLTNVPLLARLEKQILAAEAQERVARKMNMPKLGAGLNYTLIGERTDMAVAGNGRDAIMPMISVSLPIYRKKNRAAIKETEYMQSSLREMKQEVTNDLLVRYEEAMYNLEKAREEYELYTGQMEKVRQTIRLLSVAYGNSGEDFEEILQAQQQLLRYQIASAAALKDYHTAIARLEYLFGVPTYTQDKDR